MKSHRSSSSMGTWLSWGLLYGTLTFFYPLGGVGLGAVIYRISGGRHLFGSSLFDKRSMRQARLELAGAATGIALGLSAALGAAHLCETSKLKALVVNPWIEAQAKQVTPRPLVEQMRR